VDTDDDGDGFNDGAEVSMGTDALGNCPTGPSHDAWPPDGNHDKDADVGDVLTLFFGVVLNPANYSARADVNGDGDNDVGDVLGLFFDKILTRCAAFSFTNNTGGAVDDIHIQWSTAIGEVFSARDSELAGWSSRTISGGGLVLDIDRPDGSGDLAAGGQVTVVVRGSNPAISSCRWTLDGVDKGAC